MRNDIILIEKAMEMAKKKNKEINCYQEYKDAYYFFVGEIESDGGSESGFVILKKGGKILKPYEYFMNPASKVVEIGENVMF